MEIICSDDRRGTRKWGADNWSCMKRRLSTLMAAPTLFDMGTLPGNCHELTLDRKGQFAVSLWGPYRLIFEPNHNPLPVLPDGGINRTGVTKITIVEVVNYHD